jgi:hypothetical protein
MKRVPLKKLLKVCAVTAVVSLAIGWLCGCDSPQQEAAKASLQVTIVMQAAQQGEIAAHNQHLIPDNEHQFIQQQFISLAEADKAANLCVSQATNKGAVISCLNAAIGGVDSIYQNGGLFLKSQTARNNFSIAIIGVRGVLSAIEATLGGSVPAQPAFAGGAQ